MNIYNSKPTITKTRNSDMCNNGQNRTIEKASLRCLHTNNRK